MSTDDSKREFRVPLRVKVRYKRHNTFFLDYTENISQGGMFIGSKKPLDPGTELDIALALPEEDKEVVLRGVVRWTVSEEEAKGTGQKPGMGIAFPFRDIEEQKALRRFVSTEMKERLGGDAAKRLLGKTSEMQLTAADGPPPPGSPGSRSGKD